MNVMNKITTAAWAALLGLVLMTAGAGCRAKPSESECRKAIANIRELTGTANIQGTDDIESAVRSCRGNATPESVRCAIEAGSLDQLERCGLLSKEEVEGIRGKAGTGTGTGTGTGAGTGTPPAEPGQAP